MLHRRLCLALAALALADRAAAKGGVAPGDKDWMDSPFTGAGETPPGVTQVYVSCYLDRLLSVDENAYNFNAKFYFYLSWIDKDAPIKQAEATKGALAENGECSRLCNGQRSFGTTNKCCTSVWTPTLILRNVAELPQGRTQPYTISVSADGKVAWRVEVQGTWYTFLNLHAFPLDRQRLTVLLAYTNFNTTAAYVELIPSASGKGIFTQASVDDDHDSISGWDVTDVFIETRPPRTFLAQFVTADSVEHSAPDDPLPVNPPLNATKPLTSLGLAKQVVSSVEVVIDIKRLRANYAFSVLLPIIFVSSISWVAFLIDPTGLSLRVSTVLTSLLSLLALQFVIEEKLPNSSYVLPTKQLVLLSYASLAFIAFESVAVFELSRWPQLRVVRAERKAALESVAHARQRDARQRGISGARAWCGWPPSAAQLSHLHAVRSRSLQRDATFGVHIEGDCPDGDPRHNANGGARNEIVGPATRRQSSSGDGRGHALPKDADTPEGGTATGRRLEAAYYRALAHRVDMCTFAFVALAYACSVAGILLGGLTNQPRVRPLLPSHGARVVPLPPLPA